MSRRPSEGPAPAPLSPSRQRPDLDPMDRAWETWPVEPGDWRRRAPSISKSCDPARGDRFFRALIAMQTERNAAFDARRCEAAPGGEGE